MYMYVTMSQTVPRPGLHVPDFFFFFCKNIEKHEYEAKRTSLFNYSATFTCTWMVMDNQGY